MAATSIDTNKVSTYAVQDYSLAYNSCSNSISKCSELYSLLPNDFPQKATVGSIVNNLSTLKSDINSSKEVILSKIKYILSTESNSKSSALLMGKSAEELELEEELRTYGFTDTDVERIMNGEITPEDLLKEINNDTDSSRRRYMLEAQMLSGMNLKNMDELKELQDKTKQELENLIKQKEQNKLSSLELTALPNIIARIQQGDDLEYVINSEIVAWKYKDENGKECYIYEDPFTATYDGSITYEAVSYGQMYKNSKYIEELKSNLEKVEINPLFGFIGSKRTVYKCTDNEKIASYSEKIFAENDKLKKQFKELENKIKEKHSEWNSYKYTEEYITNEVDNYMNNIDPYVRNENFEKNSVMNEKEVLDTLKQIDQRYTEGLELLGSTYACVVGDNKEELMQIFSYIINGKNEKGDAGNLYIPSSDRNITVFYNDPIIANFQKWQGHMSEDEIKVFNYIYNTQSADEAYAYLENISKTLDSRWLVAKTREDQEYATEHPVAASIASIFITPVEGIFAGIASLNYKIHGGELYRSDVYSSGAVLRAAVSENIGEKTQVGKFFYDAGMSMADSAVSIGATVVTGGATISTSSVLMGSRAYVSTLNDALDRGIDTDKAILLATTSAAVETLAESYSLGHLMNLEGKMGKYVSDLTTKVAQKFSDPVMAKAASKLVYIGGGLISQGLAEAEEEVATEILNNFADEVISGELSNFSLSIKNYMELGFTEEEATNMAISDNIEQLGTIIASSFLSGGVMGGASAGISSYNISRSINQEMLNQYNGNSALAFADIVSYNTNIARLETELNKNLTKQKLREIGNKVKDFFKKNNSNGNFSIINSELDPVISDFEQAYELYSRGGLANMLVTTEKGENGKKSGYSLFSSLDYAGGPTLVSSEEFKNLSSKSQYGTLVRGVSGPLAVQHASQFKTGDLYVDSISSSPRGTGVYDAYGIDSTNVKQNYASNSGTTSGQVLEMTLSQDAKVIDYKTVSSEQAKVLDIMARKFTKYDSAIVDFDTLCVNLDKITDVNVKNKAKFITNVLSDIGYYAALKGYDAIVDSDTGYFNILNRGKVYVKEVKQLNTSSNLSKYAESVNQAKQILQDISPVLVELYEKASAMGKSILEFLGYEEHNFVHITRVADTSVAVLIELEKMINSGVLKGYSSIPADIVYLAGLAHDLGMRYEQGDSYVLKDNGQIVPLEEPNANLIRKNHPINSAITVLNNRQIFGENTELIACLALIHSKSTSRVSNISSVEQLTKMVMNLYNNQESCGYTFDISKLGLLETKKNTEGVIETSFNFYPEVLEQFKTGSVALRIGDAHAAKTGFNHGGGEIVIETYPGEVVTTENFRRNISALCELEASEATININYSDQVIPLEGGDFDFSKRVVLGERNVEILPTKFENGQLIHTMRVKSEVAPACSWVFGIEEKFGEYRTFIDIPQSVVIELPTDAPPNLSLIYEEFILKSLLKDGKNGLKSIVLKQGNNKFEYTFDYASSQYLGFIDTKDPNNIFDYIKNNISEINILINTKQVQDFIDEYLPKIPNLITETILNNLSSKNITPDLIEKILSLDDSQFDLFATSNKNVALYEVDEILDRTTSSISNWIKNLSVKDQETLIKNDNFIKKMLTKEALYLGEGLGIHPENIELYLDKINFTKLSLDDRFTFLVRYIRLRDDISIELQNSLILKSNILNEINLYSNNIIVKIKLNNFLRSISPTLLESYINKYPNLKLYLTSETIDYLVNNVPDSILLSVDIPSMESVLRNYDYYLQTVGTNVYGADQNATAQYMQVMMQNIDWLVDEELLKNLLVERYDYSDEKAIEFIEQLKYDPQSSKIINSKYWSIIADYISEYCIQYNRFDYNDIKNNSFKFYVIENSQRLLNKLIYQGMDYEDAVRTLSAIDSTGICTYAAYANEIFLRYRGKEELFYKHFGYPMFTEIFGQKELNFSELLLDMYLYINSDLNGGTLFRYDYTDFGGFQINSLYTQYQKYLNQDINYINNFFKYKGLDIKFIDINCLRNNVPDKISLNGIKGIKKVVQDYLSTGNGSVWLIVYKMPNKQYRFFNSNLNYFNTINGGHAICITGVTNNYFIVSSWGKRMLIPIEDFVDNKFEFRFMYLEGIE